LKNNMIELIKKLTAHEVSHADLSAAKTLSLPIDARIKSRQRATLNDGTEAGLFLERGTLLRGGDVITDGQGTLVVIKAADETVSTVRCADPLLLAKIAYHLGNRHVPLQIESGWLRFQHDHVLEDMVRQLPGAAEAAEVICEQAPFEPESGAYQQGGGHHHHSHSDSHSHSHEHTHGHSHGHSH
jgi:urease accessory protein